MGSVKRSRPLAGFSGFSIRILLAGLCGGLGGFGGAIFGDWPGALGLALTVLCYAGSMAGGLLIALWWWRDIDEAAKEAHKWAWWWGGCSGMALGVVLLMTAMARSETEGLPSGSTIELFIGGIVLMLLLQTVGYGIAWAVWWLKHR